ncbi:MAG TPA: RNA-binding protein [Nannocystis exedens]|nr:RNA-binding protein [Nannocystis exedens]
MPHPSSPAGRSLSFCVGTLPRRCGRQGQGSLVSLTSHGACTGSAKSGPIRAPRSAINCHCCSGGDLARSSPRRSSHGDEESVKLFIGGLAWGTDEASLRAAFEKFGAVTNAAVILDRDTGRSRGFGFITFADADSGKRALAEMNGFMLDGRAIRCNEATDRPGRGRGEHRGGGPRGGDHRGSGPIIETRMGGRSFSQDGSRQPGRGDHRAPDRRPGQRSDHRSDPRSDSRSGGSRYQSAPPFGATPGADDRSKRSREKKRRVREPVPVDDHRGSRSRAPRRRGGGGGGRPGIFKNLEDYDDDVE